MEYDLDKRYSNSNGVIIRIDDVDFEQSYIVIEDHPLEYLIGYAGWEPNEILDDFGYEELV